MAGAPLLALPFGGCAAGNVTKGRELYVPYYRYHSRVQRQRKVSVSPIFMKDLAFQFRKK